ncbi:hypothetical protein C8R43DRAFT_644130 [Mycena crocata]|nr:hypothetical protein C8R43DRAFT_644130 [Mycena crocata]
MAEPSRPNHVHEEVISGSSWMHSAIPNPALPESSTAQRRVSISVRVSRARRQDPTLQPCPACGTLIVPPQFAAGVATSTPRAGPARLVEADHASHSVEDASPSAGNVGPAADIASPAFRAEILQLAETCSAKAKDMSRKLARCRTLLQVEQAHAHSEALVKIFKSLIDALSLPVTMQSEGSPGFYAMWNTKLDEDLGKLKPLLTDFMFDFNAPRRSVEALTERLQRHITVLGRRVAKVKRSCLDLALTTTREEICRLQQTYNCRTQRDLVPVSNSSPVLAYCEEIE